MRIRRLDIDFRRRPSASWVGLITLIIGIAAVGGVAALHRQIDEEVAMLELTARKFSPASSPKVEVPMLSATELARMQAVVRQLNLPWERFFNGIEQAADDDVVLLNVHPDVSKGTVRIAGEARDLFAALRCIESLNGGEVFRDVQLVDHEINQQSAEAPIRFTLSARWRPA